MDWEKSHLLLYCPLVWCWMTIWNYLPHLGPAQTFLVKEAAKMVQEKTDSCSRSRSKGWDTSPCNPFVLAPQQLVKELSGLGLWLGFVTAKKQSQKGLGFGRKKSMKKMCQPSSVKAEAAESKYVFKNHTCTVNPSINTSPRQISASAKAPSLGFYWHASQQNCSSWQQMWI